MKSILRASALALALCCGVAAPALAQTQTGKPIIQTADTLPIDTAASGNLLLVAGISGTSIKITSWALYAGGTTAPKFFAGTGGANCASSVKSLTGAFPFKDQGGIAQGNGLGIVITLPRGADFCLNNSLAVQVSGTFSYAYDPN